MQVALLLHLSFGRKQVSLYKCVHEFHHISSLYNRKRSTTSFEFIELFLLETKAKRSAHGFHGDGI